MMLLRGLMLLLTFPALLLSCQKEESFEHGSNPVTASQWEFKDSVSQFKGNMDTAYRSNAGPLTSLVLLGTSTDGKGELFIQLFNTGPIGKGSFANPNVLFSYIMAGSLYYENVPANTNKFSVTITAIDSLAVEGTFSGEVLDVQGNLRTIQEGKFKASFQNNNIPPPPAGSGQLLLWAKGSCNGGPIRVKVQSQEKTIIVFQATEPACGANGPALFVLPAGQYTWEAICGSDTVKGNANVVAGSCIRTEVILQPVTGANCMLSDYSAFDPQTNELLFATKSFFNASQQVEKIQFFDTVLTTATFEYNLSYAGGRINIDVGQQYFELDVAQRVKTFHGFADPFDPTSLRVVYAYTYDATGRMSRATVALESNPTLPVYESVHTWTNGNLTKVVLKQIGSLNERTEIEYEYDIARQPKDFLLFFANQELQMFQTAINAGLNSTNAVKKSIVRDYDASGAVTNNPPADFSAYMIDPNRYVTNFNIGNGVSVYGGDVKYVLTYECF